MNRLVRHVALWACCASALAQTSAAPTQRIRAVVDTLDGTSITVVDRSGPMRLALADNLVVNEVAPIDFSAIGKGSYIGAAGLPQPDGTIRALEVLVFPEAARGTNEGHSPWDLLPSSTMTNATVADMVTSAQGRTLTLKYKGGEKKLVVPENTPVVTLRPADRSLLMTGAKVIVTIQSRDGAPVATRVLAGRNGFTPPM
jgi:hypothetical protein